MYGPNDFKRALSATIVALVLRGVNGPTLWVPDDRAEKRRLEADATTKFECRRVRDWAEALFVPGAGGRRPAYTGHRVAGKWKREK
jgi:hypothetical protein